MMRRGSPLIYIINLRLDAESTAELSQSTVLNRAIFVRLSCVVSVAQGVCFQG